MNKYMCSCCGVNPKQVHSFCFECHGEELGYKLEDLVAKVGNDHLARCSEKNCYLCQQHKDENFYETKRMAKNKALGRYGKINKIEGEKELERIKNREQNYNKKYR